MMKRKLYLVIISLVIISGQLPAQKILMKIASVTPAAGEEVRALEFEINAPVIPGSGTGNAVGKATAGTLLIKKTSSGSTSELLKDIVLAKTIAEVLFEYYDAANTLYYSITLSNANVVQLYYLSPECPTCLKLEHQVGFVFSKYKTVDIATGTTVIWDVSKNLVQ